MKLYAHLILIIFLASCSQQENRVLSEIGTNTGERIDLSMKIDSISLTNLNLDTLRLLRNEIFARHGYKFKSEDLTEYFTRFEWYEPVEDNSTINEKLTAVDKANIELIKAFESSIEIKWNKDFAKYLDQIPQLTFPICFKCSRIINTEEIDVPQTVSLNFKPEGSKLYGRIYKTNNEVALLYGFIGDFLYFQIYKYDSNGRELDVMDLMPGGCGDDMGVSAETNGVITKDLTIKTRTVTKTWDVEAENPQIDSTVSENIRVLK